MRVLAGVATGGVLGGVVGVPVQTCDSWKIGWEGAFAARRSACACNQGEPGRRREYSVLVARQ